MNAQEIQVGHIYHDGKQGLRKVIAADYRSGTVVYRLLAAKVEREFNSAGEPISILGHTSEVTLQAFAAWAKRGYSEDEGLRFLGRLQAARIKLSPGEQAFMQSVFDEAEGGALEAGSLVSYDHTEGRAVSGLQKKGLLNRVEKGEAELSLLGAARLQLIASSS